MQKPHISDHLNKAAEHSKNKHSQYKNNDLLMLRSGLCFNAPVINFNKQLSRPCVTSVIKWAH